MADRWTVFSHAVKYCLEGWPALHIAHQQGFGGDNFREKLEWLLDVIVQVFKDNEHVYPDELQEYISECLYNEFDIIVDDGTGPMVLTWLNSAKEWVTRLKFPSLARFESHTYTTEMLAVLFDKTLCVVEKLCHFNLMCQSGQCGQVVEELRIPPPSCPPIQAVDGMESDDECQGSLESNQHSSVSIEENSDPYPSLNTDGNTNRDQNTPMEDDDSDGWEVVQRSKKKHDSRKSR